MFTPITLSNPDSNTTCSARLVVQDVVVPVYTNLNSITSNSIISPIHNTVNRGSSTENNLLTINCDIKRNNINIASSGYLNYKGFSRSAPTDISLNNISLIPDPTTPILEAYSKPYLQGYYLNAKYSVELTGSSIFTDSPYLTICTLIQKQNDYLGNELGTQILNSSSFFSFYRDSFSTIPTITNCVISLHSTTNFIQISGVYCAAGNKVQLNASTTATDLGKYFYNSTALLSYTSNKGTISGDTRETAMPTEYYNADTKIINSSITFNNTSGRITYTSGGYDTNCQINVTPWSWKDNETPSRTASSNQILVIFDPLSLSLSLNTSYYPTSIQSATDLPGYRIWSGVANSLGVVNLPTSTSYTTIPYSHSWDINSTTNGVYDATGELQIYNGLYSTKGVAGSYLNYNSYSCPSDKTRYDYSSVLANYRATDDYDKRYASFVWKCNQLGSYYYVKFMIYGCTQDMSNINNAGPIEFTQSYTAYKMNLYFRIEDTINLNTYNGTTSNTTWINATKTLDFGISNIKETSKVLGGKLASKINTSLNNTLSIYSEVPTFTITNDNRDNIYIYARIELPMAANIGFKYITAKLTTALDQL
jgi:hypothetical protein